MPSNDLPIFSRSQRTGYNAIRCLYSNHPNSWVCKELSGDDDFGLDLQIQVAIEKQFSNGEVKDEISHVFYGQIKGTNSPEINVGNEFISWSIDRKTLNYYGKIDAPIMFIVVDLSNSNGIPGNGRIYYSWIDDQIERIRSDSKNDNSSQNVSIRIPLANTLSHNTDITDYLINFSALSRIGAQLHKTASTLNPDAPLSDVQSWVGNIAEGFSHRPASLMSAIVDASTYGGWANPQSGSFSWLLMQAAIEISRGSFSTAESFFDSASSLNPTNTNDQAELLYVKGLIFSARGLENDAFSFFKNAASLHKTKRYIIAACNSEIRCIQNSTCTEIDLVYSFDTVDSLFPDVDFFDIKSRILFLCGKTDEALELLKDSKEARLVAVSSAIYFSIGNIADAEHKCLAGLSLDQKPASSSILHFLSAMISIEKIKKISNLEFSAQEDLLSKAWKAIELSLDFHKQGGDSYNIELLVEPIVFCSPKIGNIENALSILDEFLKTRPSSQSVLEGIEILNSSILNSSILNFSQALSANIKLNDTPTVIARRICLLHFNEQHHECVAVFEKNKPLFSGFFRENFSVFLFAAVSAIKLFNPEVPSFVMKIAEENPDFCDLSAILRYNLSSDDDHASGVSFSDLQTSFKLLGKPRSMVSTMILALNPFEKTQSLEIVDLFDDLNPKHTTTDQKITYLRALETIGKHQKMIDFCSKISCDGQSKYVIDIYHASALYELKKFDESISLLEKPPTKTNENTKLARLYCFICQELDDLPRAIRFLEKMIPLSSNKTEKIRFYFSFFEHLVAHDKNDNRLFGTFQTILREFDVANLEHAMCFRDCALLLVPQLAQTNPGYASLIPDVQKKLTQIFTNFPAIGPQKIAPPMIRSSINRPGGV
jgi:tetratricopeptide (TPR) repeat protein